MDTFTITLWVLRLTFVGLIYVFFIVVARALWRDLRASVAGAGASLGRLIVIGTTDGGPATGTNYPLDAVNSIGRDVNNSIVIDDTYVSADHALLTFRGRAWYVEDHGSTNGTWVNGNRVATYLPLGYGDELQIGRIRLRLERARPT
jgi:hypothetical protein